MKTKYLIICLFFLILIVFVRIHNVSSEITEEDSKYIELLLDETINNFDKSLSHDYENQITDKTHEDFSGKLKQIKGKKNVSSL